MAQEVLTEPLSCLRSGHGTHVGQEQGREGWRGRWDRTSRGAEPAAGGAEGTSYCMGPTMTC